MFSKVKEGSIDSSDVRMWCESSVTHMLVNEIKSQQGQALKALIKGGQKAHDEHASLYKAYEKVLFTIEGMKDLK